MRLGRSKGLPVVGPALEPVEILLRGSICWSRLAWLPFKKFSKQRLLDLRRSR